jgi:OmpA-OmpF porin, OOP family
MKQNLLFTISTFFSLTLMNAQTDNNLQKEKNDFNRWSIELATGQSKGVKPYAEGYYSTNPEKVFGGIQINSFDAGVRYMMSPRFGFKLNFGFDKLENQKNSGSLPFELQQYKASFQGVINAMRLFKMEDAAGRWGLLLHGGIQASQQTSKTNIPAHNYNISEYNGGLILGFSPQFRITNSIALFGDLSVLNNYRQHFNWDGSYSETNNNLSGQLITTSLGISVSLGSNSMHGDWMVIEDDNSERLQALNKRIGDVETMMNDTDKDGVPDYLDAEPNSIAGVAVDSKGRMIDMNRNGIPDELEKYLDKTISSSIAASEKTANNEMLGKLINDGYISAYFDVNKTKPTSASTENIAFILTYLRNNPSKAIDIIGHADELGNNNYNEKLAANRAAVIKNTLVKAGINAGRINVISSGEDTSVDKTSGEARSLVRRVTFKIK